MIKKYSLIFTLFLMSAINIYANNKEDLLILVPPQCGDIANIDEAPVETIHVYTTSYADGMVHFAAYKDGIVTTFISSTTSASKKEIGKQRIFRNKKEHSHSSHYFLDTERPNTLVHVHDKYIVYTSLEKQEIVPRKK